jgi:hypothetical protein
MVKKTSLNQKDALLIKKTSLPSATGTVYSEAFDLGDIGERGVRIDPFELLLTTETKTAVQLPAGSVNTFSYQFSDDAEFSTNLNEISGTAWKQTGSADGALPYEQRFRPSTDAQRFVRVQCVTTGTASQTGQSFEFSIVT